MTRIVRSSMPAHIVVLMVGETLLLFACYCLAAYFTQAPSLDFFLLYDDGISQIALVVVVIQIGLFFQRLYETPVPRSKLMLAQQLCLVLGAAFLLQSLMLTYGKWMPLPRVVMIYGSALMLLLLPAWRALYAELVRRTVPPSKVVFWGNSALLEEIASSANLQSSGLQVVGYLDTDAHAIPAIPRLGGVEDIEEVLHNYAPDRIVAGREERLPVRRLVDLQLAGVQVEEAIDLYEQLMGRISVSEMQPSQFIFSSLLDPKQSSVTYRNLISQIAGVTGGVAALPFLILAAVLLRISSKGPVLQRTKSIGLAGEPFVHYRLCITGQDGETTRAGHLVRGLRLDGLPQCWNLARGDLGIWGPSPVRAEFAPVLEDQIPFFRQRYSIKPGILGWAQVNTRSAPDTLEDVITGLEYDFYYLKNMSLALDAYITLHSI